MMTDRMYCKLQNFKQPLIGQKFYYWFLLNFILCFAREGQFLQILFEALAKMVKYYFMTILQT